MGRDRRPLCMDLFCGLGGWAHGFLTEGFRVVGFDNNPTCAKAYPVASPPCQYLSTARNANGGRDLPRGMVLVREAFRVCTEAGVPYLVENVQGGVGAISAEYGPPRARHFPWYFWGDFPGFIAPVMRKNIGGAKWEPRSGRGMVRSIIPYPIARAVAFAFAPTKSGTGGPRSRGP